MLHLPVMGRMGKKRMTKRQSRAKLSEDDEPGWVMDTIN
jgi:hypothetical protein